MLRFQPSTSNAPPATPSTPQPKPTLSCFSSRLCNSGRIWQVKALVVEEEVFQNQRYIPVIGWTSAYMLPADRKQFSTSEGGMSSDSFPEVKALPPGWEWDGLWFVDTTGCRSPSRLRDAQVREDRRRCSLTWVDVCVHGKKHRAKGAGLVS